MKRPMVLLNAYLRLELKQAAYQDHQAHENSTMVGMKNVSTSHGAMIDYHASLDIITLNDSMMRNGVARHNGPGRDDGITCRKITP